MTTLQFIFALVAFATTGGIFSYAMHRSGVDLGLLIVIAWTFGFWFPAAYVITRLLGPDYAFADFMSVHSSCLLMFVIANEVVEAYLGEDDDDNGTPRRRRKMPKALRDLLEKVGDLGRGPTSGILRPIPVRGTRKY